VGNAVGIADQSARDEVEVLAECLSDRQLLLVVDNCEHLLPAVARLLLDLLRAVPGLRVLATSREALEVTGERLYPVPPLSVPTGAIDSPAVALFAERAATVSPGFVLTGDNAPLVAAVCRRLDGIPLAIELAAACLRSLSLAQVAERLDDRFALLTAGDRAAPPRQQTLRGAIDWSFALCSPQERLLWMRATVFAGSFDLTAAERVCGGAGLRGGALVPALAGLVAKSVLGTVDEAGGRRYRMLETIAEYGLARLRDPATADQRYGVDEAALRMRHLDHYVALAERFHADWFGPRQVAWSRRMRTELDNLRAALGFCLTGAGPPRAGVRLAGALHYLWYGCGQAREGRGWLERVLAADPEPGPERVRAMAAHNRLVLLQGERDRMGDLAAEILTLARRLRKPIYEAEALTVLGALELYRGDPEAASELLWTAVRLVDDVDPAHPQVAYAKILLAVGCLLRGDTDRSGELLAQTRAICHTHGDQWYLGHVMFNTALRALARPDLELARSHGRECLRLRLALNDTYGAAVGLELLAWIAAADHAHERSARLLGAADRQWTMIGGVVLYGRLSARDETLTATRAALGDAAFDAGYRHGKQLPLDEAINYALERDPPPTGRRPDAADHGPRLTPREAEVAELVAGGLTNRQIATRLVLSRRTAESHVEHILAKLGFTTRSQIAAWYAQQRD
jgi:non-specific serine/threonine protein kinase